MTTLRPGSYTVHVSGVGPATGVALLEIHETSPFGLPLTLRPSGLGCDHFTAEVAEQAMSVGLKAVFLSYASQDADAARRICDTEVGVSLFDASGSLFAASRPHRVGAVEWTRLVAVVDVPENAAMIQLFLGANGSAGAWFNHPQFEVVGPEVPVNSWSRRPDDPAAK